MFAIERQQGIMQVLKEKKSVTVTELSEKFFIGEATIRRDLEKLEKMGLIQRTYGGAVLLEGLDSEIPLSVRVTEQRESKEFIGQIAAQLVHDGDIIILDSSSTALKMTPHLKGRKKLTIITNGAQAAVDLANLSETRVYCTGGILRENSLSFVGELARNCVEGFFVDTLFFSCRAISMEKGLYDSNEDEAELRKLMVKNSRKTVLLCDHTKFDKVSFSRIGDFSMLHYIVTDRKPSQEWIDFFQQKGVELLYYMI